MVLVHFLRVVTIPPSDLAPFLYWRGLFSAGNLFESCTVQMLDPGPTAGAFQSQRPARSAYSHNRLTGAEHSAECADVRFVSKAEVAVVRSDVRFTPKKQKSLNVVPMSAWCQGHTLREHPTEVRAPSRLQERMRALLPHSGNGINSSVSPGTTSKRPALQSALAASMRSFREETKFHQMWRGPSMAAPPITTMCASLAARTKTRSPGRSTKSRSDPHQLQNVPLH
jgi:hypothetical protein